MAPTFTDQLGVPKIYILSPVFRMSPKRIYIQLITCHLSLYISQLPQTTPETPNFFSFSWHFPSLYLLLDSFLILCTIGHNFCCSSYPHVSSFLFLFILSFAISYAFSRCGMIILSHVIILGFVDHLCHATQYSDCFICIIVFNSHNNSKKKGLL